MANVTVAVHRHPSGAVVRILRDTYRQRGKEKRWYIIEVGSNGDRSVTKRYSEQAARKAANYAWRRLNLGAQPNDIFRKDVP